MLPLPAAVLCDMDGTLVDSEEYWITAEVALAARHGGTWTHEDGLSLIGNSLPVSAQALRERAGIVGSDDEIIDELLAVVTQLMRERGVPWRPGARELLADMREADIPVALVTMSYRVLADAVAAELPDGTFDVVITGDEVTHGKPHPEPYLSAASAVGVDITSCIGIEDSPTGLASVEAAGARSIGIPCLVDIPPAHGRSRIGSLREVSIDDLCAIAAGHVIDRLEWP